MKAMGTIQVRIMRCSSVGPSYANPSLYTAAPDAALLHERSKKAQLSHQTGLGAAVPTAARNHVSVTWIDSHEAPFATLELAYRSRALLELNDIVPGALRS